MTEYIDYPPDPKIQRKILETFKNDSIVKELEALYTRMYETQPIILQWDESHKCFVRVFSAEFYDKERMIVEAIYERKNQIRRMYESTYFRTRDAK